MDGEICLYKGDYYKAKAYSSRNNNFNMIAAEPANEHHVRLYVCVFVKKIYFNITIKHLKSFKNNLIKKLKRQRYFFEKKFENFRK